MVERSKHGDVICYTTVLNGTNRSSKSSVGLTIIENESEHLYWIPRQQNGEYQELLIKTKAKEAKHILISLNDFYRELILKGATEFKLTTSKVCFKPKENDEVEITFSKPGFFNQILSRRKSQKRPYHDIIITAKKSDLIASLKEILNKFDRLKNKEG
ncbi:MAG: hypothetical protein COV29_03070 [Candidatus Yanofskybacteria bacterium CG10_big_fil_rev_8_21_14_0_10_36_16]|uniref:Uncharacterized protein n=1 Tax=Candidatus Yanofskybacteria bacterium CG10_big_fil_rev_8_21_14_0_10_36_16 TaxID=1975096 RepID=A0A2J0Q6W1_9BACT|nr:MAG: hypothetical protein COV29_03070 [Candidatus Yanofskybacteria bacterium CG10_big_fil_rev_8_21_14_0_10_36_16]